VRRPLRKLRDFARFVGQNVSVQLQGPMQGRKNFKGRLRSVGDEQVAVEVNGQVFQLALADIKRARLEIEF
jgi:ribosome maturation factor RimP